MKKNYFGMIMAAVVMMIAGFSLSSCSEKDVAIVDGEVWVKPEYQLTDDGVIVKGSSPADISRMISRAQSNISDAAKAGKSFNISVDASAINSTSSDNTISIPTPPNADLVLSFTNPIKTEVPLVLQSKGASDDVDAQPSSNKLEIDLPSGSSNIDLDLNFPTTTVTLKGSGTINELVSKTATNTLIIESGVTVDWLLVKDGRVLVKDGGKINGYIRETDWSWIDVSKDGVNPTWKYGPDVYYLDNKEEIPYCTQKVKVVKGDGAFSNVVVHNGQGKNDVEIYIVDCGIRFNQWTVEDEKGVRYPAKIKFIKGEGDATIYTQNYYSTDENGKVYGSLTLESVKELSNVTVDLSTFLYDEWNGDEQKYELKEKELEADVDLPVLSNDCTFKTIKIRFYNRISGNSVTASNCKFIKAGADPAIWTDLVNFANDKSSFNFIFDGCEFKDKMLLNDHFDHSNGERWVDENGNAIIPTYWWHPLDDNGQVINNDWLKASADLAGVPDANKANGEWNDYDGYVPRYWDQDKPAYFKDYTVNITFTNTKINGKAITKDNTEFINSIGRGVNSEGKYCTTTLIAIDGKTYKPMLDPDTEKYILVAAE